MIRAAVIGAGWYAAENHIPTLARRPDVVLDGVCRLGAAELARVRAHFGFAFASEDHRDLLARRPDVVIVASPHRHHYAHVRDALEAGAHVLCEKPMTLDPQEAHDLAARARRLGRHLLVANGYHYLPHLPALRARLADGVVGRIEHVMCSFISATRPVFDGTVGLARWSGSFFRPAPDTWQDPAAGGGFAYGQMSHAIALMLWMTGLVPVRAGAAVFAPRGIDLADAATLECEGGAVVALSGAAAMPEGHRALMRLHVAGSAGVMSLEFDRDAATIHRAGGVTEAVPLGPGDWTYACTGPVDALCDLAQGRGANLSPAETGAATTAVIAALLASARAGGAPLAVVQA